jgi:signal transduction histidine kinase/DNA-binding response OmpR family regulator/HPt (histidine-containing phosphotransfer) domain-containing protein
MPVFSDPDTLKPALQRPFSARWALFALGLFALGLFIALSLHNDWREIDQREGERLQAQARIVHDALSRQIDAINRVLIHLRKQYPEWQTSPLGSELASRRLQAFSEAMPGVRTLLILDKEGTVYATSRPELQGRNFADRPHFVAAREKPDPNTLYVGAPFKTVLGVWGMNLAHTILTRDGKFDGIVTATLDPTEFETILSSVRYSEDMWTALAHGDGILFLMVPTNPGFSGADLAKPGSFFTRHRDSGAPATLLKGEVLTTGEHRLMAQHTIAPPDLFMDRPLIVAAGRDLNALYAEWRKKAWVLGAFFCLFALVSGMGLCTLHRHESKARKEARKAAFALAEKNEELKASNVALEQRHREAEAASQAKTLFVTNMSHEIRTPMNAVLGFLELLHRSRLTERQRDYVQKAQMGGRTLLGILDDILDFSRVENGNLTLEEKPFDVHALFRTLSDLLSTALTDKDVELVFRMDPQLPLVLRGDSVRLQQVVLNLAGNAIKFTGQGEVLVAVNVIASNNTHITIGFSVKDTGIGIPEDRLSAIFEGFSQAEAASTRRYGGMGLGLAISQRLITLMGGRLQVESRLGQGSHFYFSIAFHCDEESHVLEQRLLEQRRSFLENRLIRILLVDDNSLARQALSEMCQTFAWETHTVGTAEEALQALADAHAANQPFSVICIDWMMPDQDGWETLQQIRRVYGSACPPVILMITAQGRELLAEHMGDDVELMDAFLVKPITPSMLFDAVAKLSQGKSVSTPALVPFSSMTRPLAGLSLLLVEDNPLNQRVAQELLSQAGAHVEIAHNGREGVRAATTAKQPFDGILMDLQMPEMDGLEATRRLRAQGVLTPIIAMTANAMASDKEACLEAGMNAHIAKPIDVDQMIETLRHLCTGRISPPSVSEHTQSTDLQPKPPCPKEGDTVNGLGVPADPDGPEPPPVLSCPVVVAGHLDLEAALARLGGQKSLFATLARHFIHDQAGFSERIHRLVDEGQHMDAIREFHTLKGLAGTFGAKNLQGCAARMEAGLKAGAAFSGLLEEWDALEQTLAETLTTLSDLANAFDPPHVPEPPKNGDPSLLLGELDELKTLLSTQNMRALDVAARLRAKAPAWLCTRLQALEAPLSRLDFEEAHQQATALLDSLKT